MGASFQSTVRISPTELIANESKESIHLDGCMFSLSSNSLEKGVSFLSNSSLKMGNLNSQILLKADLKNPFSKSLQGNCQLQIQEFPLKIAELILSEKLVPIFGNSFDGSCTLNIDSESTNLTVKAATPLLKVSEMKFRIDEQVSLLEPILADYHSSPRLSPIQLSIDQCTFPLRSWEKLSFNCHFQIPAIHHWMVEKLQGKISVNTLENISAEIAGGELQMKGLFALNKEMKELQLKQPLSLDYVLSPTRFQTFFPPDAKTPLLLSPATLHLSIEPFCLSLTDSILKKLKTSASGSIDSLSLQYEQQMHKLKNIQFRCAHDAPEKSLEIYFKTEGESIELKALAKSFQFDKKYDFSKAHLNLSIKAEEFSLALLDGLTFKSHPLTTLFGPSLNLALQVESSPEEQHLSVAAKGKLFNLETSFALKENLLEIKKPSTIDWVLNEKGYALLDRWLTGEKEAPFELQKPSHFHLSIPQLHYALKDKDFSKIAGVATLTSDHCSFIDKKTSRLVSLDNFKVALEHLDQKSPISLDLQGSVNKDGKLALKADYNSSFAKIEGQIQKLPTVLLDICARPFDKLDAPFTLFFGDTINVAVSTELKNFTGPIHLNIHSPNVRTGLTGAFETGILTLKEPLHAQLLLTHKISSLFLKEINPLSITSIESLHPVTLQIDPEGFSLPLFADWRKLSVPSAHIELGQIFCKNEGNLHRTLKLLKQNLDHHVDLTLWFTPIDLHIQDQLCSLERTEILINNSLEICTFGKIDLEKENVNMILGLTSQCLHKAFGIENLPPDYLLQIPLKGSMDNVKLDTKKATAKITSLLLWQKSGLASNALGKGSAGALIGEMIGKLATLPDKDKSAPAAKQPFPWDKNKVAKIKQPKTKKKSRIKKKDKPLKQLLKILT